MQQSTDSIAANWQRLEERIGRAAEAASRNPTDIEIVAVAKTRSPREIEAAIAAGARHVGENKVQEAAAVKSEVTASARWHFIGPLQTNKTGRAVDLFDVVQSVDSERLAQALDRRATQSCRTLDILVQVNTAGSASQSGVSPAAVMPLVDRITTLSGLRLRGLMTIAAFTDDQCRVRSCFSRLREIASEIEASRRGVEMKYLSMGMSSDFELAIAEGANMLRLGTAIFGPRRLGDT